MQILHRFAGAVRQYLDRLGDPDLDRPSHCPQCQAKDALVAHGFYTRTIADCDFDGAIPVRRYLCQSCLRTVSLLPEFALPYLRFSIPAMALFLIARLQGKTLSAALPPGAPYQRGQFWLRRFRAQAESLCAALAGWTKPAPAPDFLHRVLAMLGSKGWIAAHRFLFGQLRLHLLGWPPSLAPDGRCRALVPAVAAAEGPPT